MIFENHGVFLFYNLSMQNRFNRFWALPIALVVAVVLYYLHPIHARLAPRLDSLRTQIKYFINPPEEAVFQPSQQSEIETIVSGTLTPQQVISPPTATPTPRPGPTLTPTLTTTPLPATIKL